MCVSVAFSTAAAALLSLQATGGNRSMCSDFCFENVKLIFCVLEPSMTGSQGKTDRAQGA